MHFDLPSSLGQQVALGLVALLAQTRGNWACADGVSRVITNKMAAVMKIDDDGKTWTLCSSIFSFCFELLFLQR